jgi:hypothetical protein
MLAVLVAPIRSRNMAPAVLFQGIAGSDANVFFLPNPLTTLPPGGFHPHLE